MNFEVITLIVIGVIGGLWAFHLFTMRQIDKRFLGLERTIKDLLNANKELLLVMIDKNTKDIDKISRKVFNGKDR